MKIRYLIILAAAAMVAVFAYAELGTKNENSAPTFLPGFSSSPTPTPTPTPTSGLIGPSPTSTSRSPEGDVLISGVPFTSQAPFGNWSDPKEQAGCEEATAAMAMAWVQGKNLTPAEALNQIIAISDYEQQNYGNFYDTSAEDTVSRIYNGYFNYNKVEVKKDISATDIESEIDQGNLVIVPANGQKLRNPNYTQPGPLQHMLLIRGYDSATKEFITNDPGTRRGESYRYSESVVMNAIYDYSTGHNEPIGQITKAMIVVHK